MTHRYRILLGLFILLTVVGCGKGQTGAGQRLDVFVSILPQRFFVEKIGGNRVKVHVMVPPGKEPETYDPTPNQITELQQAKAFFTIGVPFEQSFIPSIRQSMKNLKIVDTAAGIKKRHFALYSSGHDHAAASGSGRQSASTGASQGEEQGGIDPHVWMSPLLVKKQAKIILDTLLSLDPAGKGQYQQGYDDFIKELDAVNQELVKILAPVKGDTFFVYHPSFGYFADAYGLKQVAIEMGGKDPTPRQLEGVIAKAKTDGVKVIFTQPEFNPKSAQAVASAIGGVVVSVSPLNADYFKNLLFIAESLKKGLE